ncbi:alpha-tocopherol transfer protein [Diachasmimorpha longicaudata]|uniref:alpha-tocopherol transfer protein n=1 Tax=Diachasmimorpha longicaudata TaxID=58733 RepID=UPI0030B8E7DA
MSDINAEILRMKNGENLEKNQLYNKNDGSINLEKPLIDAKKIDDANDIEKMYESMLLAHDNSTKAHEKTEIFEDALNEPLNLNTDEKHDEEELDLDLEEPPPPEVLEYARRELGETDEVKCQTLDELRDMIYERGECSPHRMDDAFLIRFLRARNFNVNRAHRLIVRYYNFKEEHPAIHENVDPLKMRHIGDDDVMTVPGYRTECGRRMMIYRMGNWDPKKYGVEEIFKATVIILELGALEPRAQILGGFVIFDLRDITMTHAWTMTPQIANMVIALMVTSFPMKTHAIHILHQSWVFDVIYSVFKPLLSKEMQERVFFHGDDMSSLHKHIKPTSLPKMYGGTREELPYYKWIDSLSKKPKIIKPMHEIGYILTDEQLAMIKNW